jgi:flagellum-specific ATP synthase
MNDLPLIYDAADGWTREGSVDSVSSDSVALRACGLAPGAVVEIERGRRRQPALAQVISAGAHTAVCAPIGRASGIRVGARARSTLAHLGSFAGDGLLGRATDAWGRPDGDSAIGRVVNVVSSAFCKSERVPITRALRTGIAAIDAFAMLGSGQRIALFAGAGVGKTTLLHRIVERCDVDARVVALVGERGREATETIAKFRRSSEWNSTTVVCATAEAPPSERLAAARTATAQAQHLASSRRHVLLVVDSLTRVASAWREIVLASGEAALHRGHPPGLPSMLAGLVEQAGARRAGTVTAVYSVLVEADDLNEPVSDFVRGFVDGHIILSRTLAQAGKYPPIDVLRSISRLMTDVADQAHVSAAAAVRGALSTLERADDLLAIGAYRPGGDPKLDAALAVRDDIEALLYGADAADHGDPIEKLEAIAARL